MGDEDSLTRTGSEFGEGVNSKGHRDAILDQHFKDVGVGYTKTSDGHVWWCTVFGCKLLDDQKTER